MELIYNDGMDHQMYTNNAMVYPRAPHIMIGFPTRYCERMRWTENYDQLGGLARRRKFYEGPSPREGLATTDCMFMCSRDSLHWKRFHESFLSPGYETEYNWVYGACIPDSRSFEVFGNNIDRRVMMEDGSGFARFAGKPVRLRFRMRDAKIYSFKFEK